MFDNHSPEGGMTAIADMIMKAGDSDLGQRVRGVIRELLGEEPAAQPTQRPQKGDRGLTD
jgi:hypothetical protein